MTSWPSALVAVLLLAAGPAGAQTLYLGEQALDTSDRRQVAGVLERCAALAAGAGEAAASAAFTRAEPPSGQAGEADGDAGNGEAVSGEDQAGALAVLTLDVEAAASSGDESKPAGEGAGEASGLTELGGDQDGEEPGGDDASSAVNLAQVTLQHCKEAGLVY